MTTTAARVILYPNPVDAHAVAAEVRAASDVTTMAVMVKRMAVDLAAAEERLNDAVLAPGAAVVDGATLLSAIAAARERRDRAADLMSAAFTRWCAARAALRSLGLLRTPDTPAHLT